MTALSKKRSPARFFGKKIEGVTPSVAALGVTHHSDATAFVGDGR